MGKNILDGSADLVALNQQSLKLRGKEKRLKSSVKPRASGVIRDGERQVEPSARERYTQTTLRGSSGSSASKKTGIVTRREEPKENVKKDVD